ncbi:MAG: hypothetical protein FJ211_09920 [Ignavibacteria bacterium]|nr:hypothetical protein [Ignavibacteria bacterium]
METVTLYAEDFRIVHNTLCELRHLTLRNRVDPEEIEELVAKFEKGLESAYKQDSEAFDRKHEYYSKAAAEMKLTSIWSIYEVENLDAFHPYEGAQYVIYDEHWGDGEVVQEIRGDTWADLYVAADAAIRRSEDGHHCFIEAFQPVANKPHHLRLTTGS